MNLPSFLFILSALIRETFRQAFASRVFWFMSAVSVLCIVFCLGVSLENAPPLQREYEIELIGGDNQPLTGPNPAPHRMNLAFGLVRVDLPRDGEAGIRFLQAMFAFWIAGTVGTLVSVIWTAGFLPAFLEPSAASVLLAKPAPRWMLLMGKFVGVLALVAVQATLFFVGTWLALGVRTGVMPAGYLLGIPLLLVHFAVVYSFSALMAVMTRSTAAAIVGSILFWIGCYATNYARNAVIALPSMHSETPFAASLQHSAEAGYWILPKPGDFIVLLDAAVNAKEHFTVIPTAARLALERNAFHPEWSILTSLAFCGLILGVAAWQFRSMDY